MGKVTVTKESLQIQNLLEEVFSKKMFTMKKVKNHLAILMLIQARLNLNHLGFFEALIVHISQTMDDCKDLIYSFFHFLRTKCNFTRIFTFIKKSLDL